MAARGYSALQRDEDAAGFSRPVFLGRGIAPTSPLWTPSLLQRVLYDLLHTKSGGYNCEDEHEAGCVLKSRIWWDRGSSQQAGTSV